MGNFSTFLSAHDYISIGAKKIVRTLSQLKDLYENQAAVNKILEKEDPVLYEVYELPQAPGHTDLLVNITILYAGRVGDELYMTKGHFHRDPDVAEIVIGLEGIGTLLLQNLAGELQQLPVERHRLSYSAGGWGHRVVNTGEQSLIFLSICEADIVHDYETAAKLNFKNNG